MPTPYGFRGGMAFGAGELRVLRRALALALHPSSATVRDVQDCHRLAESVDEAVRESARFRAFVLADLARYRAALPGTARGYLALLSEALDAEYRPGTDDLAALRTLHGTAAQALLDRCRAVVGEHTRGGPVEHAPLPAARTEPAPATGPAREQNDSVHNDSVHNEPVHNGPSGATGRPPLPATVAAPATVDGPRTPEVSAVWPAVPSARRRLLALPGGLLCDGPATAAATAPPELSGPAEPHEPSAAPETESDSEPKPESKPESESEPEPEPGKTPERKPEPEEAPQTQPSQEPEKPEEKPKERPSGPATPGRPVPTPAEVFPPKRRPSPPPSGAAPDHLSQKVSPAPFGQRENRAAQAGDAPWGQRPGGASQTLKAPGEAAGGTGRDGDCAAVPAGCPRRLAAG